MAIAYDVYFGAVMDTPVLITEGLAIIALELFDVVVGREFISVDGTLWKDVLLHHSHELMSVYLSRRSLGEYTAFALRDPDNWSLVFHLGTTAFTAYTSTEIGFIHLNRRPLQLQIPIGHQGTNLLEHAPRGLVSDGSFALDLLCGDSATGGTYLVHRVEPQTQ